MYVLTILQADINPAGEAIAKEFGHNALFVKTDTADWDSQAEMFQKGENSSTMNSVTLRSFLFGKTDK